MINVQKIAGLAKTSSTSVSLVLNDKWKKKVNPDTARRIKRVVEKHAYVCNPAAKGLATQRTMRIALCMEGLLTEHPLMGDFSFHELLSILAARLNEAGYALDIVQQKSKLKKMTNRELATIRNDDACLFLSPDALDMDLILDKIKISKPYIVIDSNLNDPELCYIYRNPSNSIGTAISYFVKAGHRRIGFLGWFVSQECGERGEEKMFGYKKALQKNNIAFDAELFFMSSKGFMQVGIDGGEKLMSLEDKPTAFFCADNMCALGLLSYFRERGIRVPEDVEIIGFGDQAIADLCGQRLSYICLPNNEMANLAVDRILKWIDDKEEFKPIQIECKESIVFQGSTRFSIFDNTS